MRRIAFITSTALAALACAFLPSGALAHGHHHRGHHYARRVRPHGRHHGRGLHAGLLGSSGSQPGESRPTGPDSSPTPPTGTENVGPTASNPQGNAGTIVSFTEGVLTIKLGEGEKATTISGKVTEETEIDCIPAAALTSPSGTPGPSDDGGWQGRQSGESGWGGDDQGDGDDQNGGDRNLEGGGRCNQCSTSNLTPGTTVHRAELLLTESGAIFREIVLVV